MGEFKKSAKTTIYWTICKEKPCIWCQNQIQGCLDILLLKVDFYAFFFQFADGNQAVDRVSGEAADRFCDDEVDFVGHGIGDHFIEADAMLGVRAGNALVRVYFYKLPFGIAFDVLRVIIHLCLVAGELLISALLKIGTPLFFTRREGVYIFINYPFRCRSSSTNFNQSASLASRSRAVRSAADT